MKKYDGDAKTFICLKFSYIVFLSSALENVGLCRYGSCSGTLAVILVSDFYCNFGIGVCLVMNITVADRALDTESFIYNVHDNSILVLESVWL